jgi:SAM-dependent methyltransferase
MDTLAAYYARRALEYDRLYERPERQAELGGLRERLGSLFAGRRVLELACGTGYWTSVLAATAEHVTALDVNEEVLALARRRDGADRVTFLRGDAYAIPDLGRAHDALFAGFWWSHVPRTRLDAFVEHAVSRVAPGATFAFLDNRFVEGSSTPLSRWDGEGNSYQLRRLDDGSTYEVLKNFPGEPELFARASRAGIEARVELSPHYWLSTFRAA